jgi:phosphatidylserine/phosphatidylglycerophosphate/cardiolipin synthase-like enzyme
MKITLLSLLLVLIICVGIWGLVKPLPAGINLTGEKHQLSEIDIHFFKDLTYVDQEGVRHTEQEIFDEALRMINNANTYILVDMFFFSDFIGTEKTAYRNLAKELTNALIEKKKQNNDLVVQVITDPINTMYGGYRSEYFQELEESGVNVITTDLSKLRDSNPIYSAFWRSLFQWFGNSSEGGVLPNPLDSDSPRLTIRTYLSMLNYKANHRKLILTDYERSGKIGFSTLVTSANPHDGSSAHSNSAVRIDARVWRDVLLSEKTVAEFSGETFIEPDPIFLSRIEDSTGSVSAQLITERAIKDQIMSVLNAATADSAIDIAMFYIADRDIVQALKLASARGAQIRLLLDPNKDAFGREKDGMPNRQVAEELVSDSSLNIEVRWCDTHGEQCHSKLLIAQNGTKRELIIGSANYTRRNLDNYNLETDIYIASDAMIPAIEDAVSFFERTWNNEDGKQYSVPYSQYAAENILKTIIYRIKEPLGINRW